MKLSANIARQEREPQRLARIARKRIRDDRIEVVRHMPANPANARPWREAQDAARALGVTLQSQEVRAPTDFERVFAVMARERPDALLLIGDALIFQHGRQIVDFVTQKRVPSMFDLTNLAAAGGLMSYATDLVDLYRRAATFVDKIQIDLGRVAP